MTHLEDVNYSTPLEPREERVHDSNHVLNEIKRIFVQTGTDFNDLSVVNRQDLFGLSSEYPLSNQNDIASNGVTHNPSESEYRIRANDGTESLESVQQIRYAPGFVTETGSALRVPTAPTGDQEIKIGYWDGSDGVYLKWIDTGFYIETMRNGVVDSSVAASDWNSQDVDSLEEKFKDGLVYRQILELYNQGQIKHELIFPGTSSRMENPTFHRTTPEEKTTLSSQNLPIRVEVTNPEVSDYDVYVANRQAAIRGRFNPEKRVKGDKLAGVSLNGTSWVPLMSFRKKQSFEAIAVELFDVTTLTDENVFLQIRSDVGSTTDSDYSPPDDVNSGETAIEVDKSPSADITDGDFRYETLITGGNKASAGKFADVDLEDNRQRPFTIFMRTISANGGNLNGLTLNWTEQW